MSMSTTLTLSPVSSAENLQQTQFYQNSSNNKNNTVYYNFVPETKILDEHINEYNIYSTNNITNSYVLLPTEDTVLLEKACASNTTPILLHKSNSYSSTIKTKSTIIKQDSINGRIATSLTDSDSDSSSAAGRVCCPTTTANVAAEGEEEQEAFLVNESTATNNSSSRRALRSHSKKRTVGCCRLNSFLCRSWYLNYIVPLSILLALMFVAYLTRDYAKRLLYWIETQNPWVIFALFMVLFIVVSFPIVVGYFVLMITAGYLFGCLKGFLTVILGANVGIAIAHFTIRSFRHRIPMHRLIKNETGRAILRVISGPRAFKVVLFTRLTPIPFGIQNAIFGVSSINPRVYHSATFLGLLPAQTINVYLGSTLRSMHEVLNNHGTALTGYISFGVEVVCGVALMFWVVQKARKELSETLLSDISTEGKLIDIQV